MRTRLIFLALAVLVAGCASSAPPSPAMPVVAGPPPPPAAAATAAPAPAPIEEPRELVGYVFRDDAGALAIDPLDRTPKSAPPSAITGPLGTELAARLDACESDDTLEDVAGRSSHVTRHASRVIVHVRDGEIVASLDACAWSSARKDYFAALVGAEKAFTRNDAKGARKALEQARDVAGKSFGELAPHLELFRFIDGLAARFGRACDRIAGRSDDAVAYADAVTPLHRAKTMKGRELPLPEETRMVLAAFRFARRAVYRELRAETGEGHSVRHARAIVDMAPVGHDVEMFHWVVEHVREAVR